MISILKSDERMGINLVIGFKLIVSVDILKCILLLNIILIIVFCIKNKLRFFFIDVI